MPALTAPVINTAAEGILKPENCKTLRKSLDPQKTTFWGALLASAERRKSVDAGQHATSPLSTVMEELEVEEEQESDTMALNRDADGDVIMETIDPAVLERPDFPSLPRIPDISSPVNSLMGLVSKKLYRRERQCMDLQSNKDQAHSMLVVTTPPPPAVLKSEEKVRLIILHGLMEGMEGMEPLSRVRSRGR